MSLKERGAITGIGETAYSRNSGKSVVALQMEASLAAIADAGLAPTDIDGIIAYAPSGVVAEDFVTNFGIPDLRFSATTPMGGASAVAAVQCALGGGRDRRLPSRPHPARPQRGLGQPDRRPGPRDAAVPRRRRVRDAGGRARAGAALRAHGPSSHGALRDHQPPVRRDRRGDPPARGAPRQRHHDRAHHDRGPSGLAHDRRPPPAARLQPRERRRRRRRRQRGGARPGPGAAAGLRDGRRRGPSRFAERHLAASGPHDLWPRQGGAARVRDGRGRAGRHRRRRDLRLLHLHRPLPRSRTSASAARARAAPSSRAERLRWAAGSRSTRTAGSCPRRTWRA